MAAIRTSTAVASSLPAYARTAGRAVHIKIKPRPLNLAESRQVLRTLQEYGEVVMYKHLKYEPEIRAPHTALAIFGTEKATAKALAASPLSFSIERPGSSTIGASPYNPSNKVEMDKESDDDGEELDEVTLSEEQQQEAEIQTSWATTGIESEPIDRRKHGSPGPRRSPATSKPSSPPNAKQSTNNNTGKSSTQFRLFISPSTQNHAAYISRQHYHSRFKLDTRTIMGQDLESRVPYPGLADLQLHLGEVPLRQRNIRAEEQKRDGRGWWKKSLGELWREGRREEQEEKERQAAGKKDGVVIEKYAYTDHQTRTKGWRVPLRHRQR